MPVVFEIPKSNGYVMQLGAVATRVVLKSKLNSLVAEKKISGIDRIQIEGNKLKVWFSSPNDATMLMLLWDRDFVPVDLMIYYEDE